ncbi:nuclear receptor-interacting protein 2 isoform X1 [Hemicordylus capensis]|uniref:nuclear receptor-interacting protein 2 isoform X1 n=1 Tax=Hemicordylus capensis TaxID=884348 RepID=UPI002302E9F9|nr:nuclear receptor-interacting protein 2 isoform X1 [Hemicordylus capensis]
MSTRKTCPIRGGAKDGDQKQREDIQDPDKVKLEAELWSKTMLQQNRHLKQATQFVHKDSADLLPLDGLKRLGTSKDLQPHSVVQRRLLEENLSKLRGEAKNCTTIEEKSPVTEKEDVTDKDVKKWWKAPPSLLVHCKCQGRLLKAVVNTGCQHNLISRSCLKHLGLQEVPTSFQNAHPCPSRVVGQVERVEVQFGQEMVQCSALVVDDEMLDFCLGFQTLLSLKTCIDLDEGVLQLKSLGQELPFIHISEEQEK